MKDWKEGKDWKEETEGVEEMGGIKRRNGREHTIQYTNPEFLP